MQSLLSKYPFGYAASFKASSVAVYCVPARHQSKKAMRTQDYYSRTKRMTKTLGIIKDDLMELQSDDRRQKDVDVPYHVSSINQILSYYAPLEPFARAPKYTRLGWQQTYTENAEKFRTFYAKMSLWWRMRKIEPFQAKTFPALAQKLYIQANRAQQRKDLVRMRDLVTINLYEKNRMKKNKVIWKFVEQLEAPKLANCRISVFNTEDNMFAQVTVRLKIRQVFAEYHENGELIRGDPHKPVDVLHYIVFERPLKFASSIPWKICGSLPMQEPWRDVHERLKEQRKYAKRKLYKTKKDRESYSKDFEHSQA